MMKINKMKLIPFSKIDNNDEFWRGARFIKKKTGLLNVKKSEDYFEYMLFNDHSEWMICANIDKYEAGSIISLVKKTLKKTNRHTVTAKEFKRSNIDPKEIHLWFYHQVPNDRYWIKKKDLKKVVELQKKINIKSIYKK